MSMKKALDQTLRDIKRGVNKKVLKVPSVEQKVLDATSNEPWGPHGSLISDIAQATRNYHDYQMIMAVLWKRLNDTGKNWRHVYKALTVLEYLVAHGSERVIDDIKEHAYQISTLSNFQYIDSSGRDQGNNVRRKSQSLVVLVNDKERIQEVREKASTNKDKFRSSSAGGRMYSPGEDRYGGRDDDRNGNGRDRDWGSKDDERYGRYGDSYSREGDRYDRDSEDQYGRDNYRDDISRGRSGSVDDYQNESRSRSSDREGDRAYDEDDRHSSGGSNVKAKDHQNDGRPLERKFSEQDLGVPPSYEDAVGVSRSPPYSERDGETPVAAAAQMSPPTVGAVPQSSSPIANADQSLPVTDVTPQPVPAPNNVSPSQVTTDHGVSSHSNGQADPFDEFDPRGPFSVAPSTSHNAEMDLLGSLSDAFSPGPLAIMPASSGASDFELDSMTTASNPSFTPVASENTVFNQSFEDPFGDSPFKATPSDEAAQPHNFPPTTSLQSPVTTLEHTNSEASNLEFPNAFPGLTFDPADVPNTHNPPNQQFLSDEQPPFPENDVLAGILPPPGPFTTTNTQVAFPDVSAPGQPPVDLGYMPQSAPHTISFHQNMPQLAPHASSFNHMATQNMPQPTPHASSFHHMATQDTPQPAPHASSFHHIATQNMPQSAPHASSFHQMAAQNMPQSAPHATSFHNMATQNLAREPDQPTRHNSLPFSAPPANSNVNNGLHAPNEMPTQQNNDFLGGLLAPSNSTGSLALVPQQPAEKKFETKSTVWADTLNRGLVDLNISGSKINPLSGIGIDFDSLNRKEKRMEKPSNTPATSTVSMGKAMGSGSGMGRAGAGALRPAQNQMMGPTMGMGMGGGPGVGMGMGNYGPVNQQPMGMGVGMSMGMGGAPMGMNMGMGQMVPMQPSMGQGVPMQPSMGQGMPPMQPSMGQGMSPMQPPHGPSPGTNMNNYPMMGRGGYPQQPYQYGGGYQ